MSAETEKHTDPSTGSRPIKVLHVVNRWAQGGVERFIEGVIANAPDSLDQRVLSICSPVVSTAVGEAYGPLVASDAMTSMLIGARRLEKFLRSNRFDVVHIHTNNSSGFLYARAAKTAGVRGRIVHSHSSSLGVGAGLAKRMAQVGVGWAFRGAETDRVACSQAAGSHLFRDDEFIVVPNGIDTKRFSFDSEARSRIRNRLRIGDECIVVGCVGTLTVVKNHRRSIDIFDAFRLANASSRLVFVGDGELRGQLEQLVKEKGLAKDVTFVGHAENTNEYYSAMDVLLFPSLFEGLPLTLVEAQCNGLPIVASDTVSPEVRMSDSLVFLSLRAENEAWVRALSCAERINSEEACEAVRSGGYDVLSVVEQLKDLYEGCGASA